MFRRRLLILSLNVPVTAVPNYSNYLAEGLGLDLTAALLEYKHAVVACKAVAFCHFGIDGHSVSHEIGALPFLQVLLCSTSSVIFHWLRRGRSGNHMTIVCKVNSPF